MNISKKLATALFCVIAATASQAYGVQEQATSKPSLKQKLTAFQDKVKQRFDSLRGFENADDPSAAAQDAPMNHFHFDQRRMSSTAQPTGHPNAIDRRQTAGQASPNQRGHSSQSGSPVAQAAYVQQNPAGINGPNHRNMMGHRDPGRVDRNEYLPVITAPPYPVAIPGNEPLSSTTYSMPNQGRATNGVRTVQTPGPMATQQANSPMMENSLRPDYQPMANAQRYAEPGTAAQSQQRMGHFQNGFSRVRTLTDQQQVTASERVLQLQAQIEALVAERSALMADNKRLSAIIAENRQMLGKAEASIGASLQQLESTNRNNAVLKQRVERLMAENENQKAQSKRTLDSIQQRLDELIIREVSSK